jgi:hypothetical protein
MEACLWQNIMATILDKYLVFILQELWLSNMKRDLIIIQITLVCI